MGERTELLGLYWTLSGPVEVHTGREWSLFDFADRCAEARTCRIRRHRHLARRPRARPRDPHAADLKAILDDHGLTHLELEFLQDWFLDPGDERARGVRRDAPAALRRGGGARRRTTSRSATSPARRASPPGWPSASPSCAPTPRATRTRRSSTSSCRSTSTSTTLDSALALLEAPARRTAALAIDTWHMSKLGIAPEDLRRIPLAVSGWVELSDGRSQTWPTSSTRPSTTAGCPARASSTIRGYVDACRDIGYAGPVGRRGALARSCATCRWTTSSTRAYETTAAQFARIQRREEPTHERSSTDDRLIWMYTQMVRIREFEERVKRTFEEHPGVIRGHTHLADGVEASIVGSLSALRDGDQVLTTYRCHGYPIALGTPTKAMMAEIYGRADGICKGSAAPCTSPTSAAASSARRGSSARASRMRPAPRTPRRSAATARSSSASSETARPSRARSTRR